MGLLRLMKFRIPINAIENQPLEVQNNIALSRKRFSSIIQLNNALNPIRADGKFTLSFKGYISFM